MHAAAVTRDDETVLLVGAWGSGKSTLATTLFERGWKMLADDVAVLTTPDLEARAFPLEPSVRQAPRPVVRNVSALPRARVRLDDAGWASSGPPPTAIVYPSYDPSRPGGAHRVADGEATLVLLSNVLNLGDHEQEAVARLGAMVAGTRKFALVYGYPERAADTLEAVLRGDAEIDPAVYPLSKEAPTEGEPVERPATKWDGVKRRLTVGMATYDDFDGVYFTVQAMRMSNKIAPSDLEILVIDNHPEGQEAEPLAELANWIPGYRYVPNDELQGTATRDLVFREATSDWVICVDSHVLLEPGALDRFMEFAEANPDCPDLLQGPLIFDDLENYATHFDPKWRAGMFGVWGTDERGASADHEPFEIPMQGLGVFGCRRDAWLGFNPRFRGFGGEEGYIHEKYRHAGHRTQCLPFLRWLHRFPRPGGPTYRNDWGDRIRNYMIGLEELGMAGDTLEEHFEDLIGSDALDTVLGNVRAELDSPLHYFDVVYLVHSGDRQAWEQRRGALGMLRNRERKFQIPCPDDPRAARASIHRAIVERARRLNLRSVLVVEEGFSLREDLEALLAPAVHELGERRWSVFHAGYDYDGEIDRVPDVEHLRAPGGTRLGTEVVAYHADYFDELLAALPEDDSVAGDAGEARFSLEELLTSAAHRFASGISVADLRPIPTEAVSA